MNEYYFGITDPGKVRDNNEDAFLVEQLDGTERVLAAVVDGVGGYEGGEVAAAIARDCIAELLTKPLIDVAVLSATLIEINRRIVEARASQSGRDRMACVLTLALADAATNQFAYAHVGDTRLYLLRASSLVKVSKDHSFVGFLEESNRITEQNAMRHPKRNEVNKVLGSDPDISTEPDYIDTGSSPFLPGDMLLLCSDGLTDMIDSREITTLLTSTDTIPRKAKALIDAANKAGGKDNITVVLVQNPKTPASYEPTMPAIKKTFPEPEPPAQPVTEVTPPKPKSGNPLLWILSIICLGQAGALAWMFLHQPKPVAITTAVAATPTAIVHNRSPAEQQLLDSLASASGSLALDTAVFKTPILLTDTLVIDKDTFRLSGNGRVLQGDSGRQGPALLLTTNARYVVLENIVFENFPTAILANNNVLQLRNVRFRNCGVPVSYAFIFPDMQPVSGAFHTGILFKKDSLADNY